MVLLPLRRAVAWILRLKKYLLLKTRRKKAVNNQGCDNKTQQPHDRVSADRDKHDSQDVRFNKRLTTTDMQKAEKAVIQYVQNQAFPEEIKSLEETPKCDKVDHTSCDRSKCKEPHVKMTSHICKLHPFMTEGVLRVAKFLVDIFNLIKFKKKCLINSEV